MTIAQLFTIAFPAVLNEYRKGKPWADPELNYLTLNTDRLKIMRIAGAQVEIPMDPGPNKVVNVSQISAPCVWVDADDLANPRENQKIDLVKRLIENVIRSHDSLILQELGQHGRGIASEDWRYDLGNIQHLQNGCNVVKVYSVIALLDKEAQE